MEAKQQGAVGTATHGNFRLSRLSMVCYGFGDLASQFVWTFVGTYLAIFYTDVIGISAGVVSVLMLVARVIDFLFDPMIGSIAERTKSRWGRFRPYILFGSPILGIFTVLVFAVPFGNGLAGETWAVIAYMICGLAYSAVNIPYGSLSAVMTDDVFDRASLNSWRSVGQNVGMIVVNSLSSLMILYFSNGAKNPTFGGYLITALIFAIISIPLFLAVFFTSKEVIQPIAGVEQKVKLKDTIKNIFANKYLMILSIMMIVQMTGFMGRIAVTTFYIIYCLGAFTLIAILMTIPSIGGAIAALFVPWITKKFGKRNALAVSLVLQGIGLIVVWLAPFDNLPMVIAGTIIFGIFNVGYPITLSMVSDCVDYQELKTNIRTDGTAFAAYSLATKIGTALGGALGVGLIGLVGYVPNARQSLSTMHGINLIVNFIPGVMFVICGIFMFVFYKLTDHVVDQIRIRLNEEMRGEAD